MKLFTTGRYSVFGMVDGMKGIINVHSKGYAHRRDVSLSDYELFLNLMGTVKTEAERDKLIEMYIGEDLG